MSGLTSAQRPFLRRPALPGPALAGGLDRWAVAAVALGIAGGVAVVASPVVAVGVAGWLFLVIGLLMLGARSARVFLGSLAVILVLYAFLGRGAAYIGVAPLYVSEVVLFIAAVALLLNAGRLRLGMIELLLLAFMAWGAARTMPFIGTYGIDALRDGVVWAYAFFALAIGATLRISDFGTIVSWYRRILPWFVIAMPIVAVVTRVFDAYIPKWPNTPLGGVGIIFFNNGHTGVHLAGVGAFILLGLYGVSRRHRLWEAFIWLPWLLGVAIAGSLNRGSLLAASAAGLAVVFVRSRSRWLSLALLAPITLALVSVANPVFDLGTVRKVSFDQLIQNVLSVFGGTSNSDLTGTEEWRLAWWNKITAYTVNGPYFWTGKGYGINLADDDGFQVNSDGSLRAPHNGNFEILARSGVPGLTLWLVLQGAYALGLLRAAIGAYRARKYVWMRIHAWLFVYWIAAFINLEFDPYLEGPHGGIWFWTLFGIGLVAMRAWKLDKNGSVEAAMLPADEQADERNARLGRRSAPAPAPVG